jgi:hypothetical protein
MPIIARLPACVLLLVVAVYTGSYCSGRMVMIEGSVVAILLLPCLWLVAMPGRLRCDGLAGWFLATAIALEAWMAGVQLLRHDALPAGWWCFAERAAGLCTVLLLLGSSLPVRVLVQVMGAAAACAVTVCLVMNASLDLLLPLSTDCFAFGHVNILANTAGPSLIVWAVLMIADWRAGERPRLRDLVLLASGIISLGVITVATQRRGVLLAVAAVGVLLAVRWLMQRSRILGLAVMALLALAAGGMALRQFSHTTPSLRNERVALYRSGVEGVVAALPCGFGHYGALHLQTVDGESCRHMTANGGYGEDIHNQLLEAALDGGPVALMLVLGLIALAALRVMVVSDARLRLALEAMGVAILIHLVTDNVYGTEVGLMWLSVAVGMMLTADTARAVLPAWRWMPDARLLAWPLALISAGGALSDVRAALLPSDAGSSSRFLCLQTALVPQSVSLHAEAILQSDDPGVDMAQRDHALDISVATMGWTIRTAIFEVERRRRTGPPAQTIHALLRVLQLSPFFKEYYEALAVVVIQHPECAGLVPPAVRQRIAYLRGDRTLPKPSLSPAPRFIDEAIDDFTAIIWSITNNVPWSDISAPLQGLVQRYGDIQGVAQLALMAVCAAPPGSFPWMQDCAPQFAVALRSAGAVSAYFGLARTPEQARSLLPIAEQLFPETFVAFRSGTLRMTNDPMAIMARTSLAHLWGLALCATPPKASR